MQFVDDILRFNELAVFVIEERMALLPFGNLGKPCAAVSDHGPGFELASKFGNQLIADYPCIADNRNVGLDVFADAGWIDVDVNDLCAFREFIELAGHPIVETRAYRY